MFRGKRTQTVGVYTLTVWIVAIVLIAVFGLTYRLLAYYLKFVTETPLVLPIPLNSFPAEIGKWSGEDIPIPENIQRVAGNDDFINRLYINMADNEWANVYISYTARPRTMVGHTPEVCYVGGGWAHDSTESSEVITKSNGKIPCLIHHFHRPAPEYEQRTVLNYYVVNGRFTSDERAFSGLGWRTPNIAGDPARYVAQVQISSVLESSVLNAVADMTDLLLDYLPDETGQVRAERNLETDKAILEKVEELVK